MIQVFKDNKIILFCNNGAKLIHFKKYLHLKNTSDKNLKKKEVFAFLEEKKHNYLIIESKNIELTFELFSSFFDIIIAGGGIVKNENHCFLAIKRNNLWDFPKGKIENNESIEQGSLREISEECGIRDLTILNFICNTYHIYILNHRWILKKTNWYNINSSENKKLIPQLEEGISQTKWMSRKEINQIFMKNTYSSIKFLWNYYSKNIDKYFD